jgi:D-psicose/D-tagatose/L-ribulose 3-epimerase
MKAGFCMLLWSTHVTEQHLPLFADIKAAGYDGVEVPTFGGDPTHYAWLRGKLDEEGLLATAVGLMPGEAYSLISDDPAARRAGAAHLDWLLECADALGAEVLCGPFHQALGVFTGRGPTEEELERLVEAHQIMADKAPELTLAIEMLNRFECYMLTSNAQAAEHVAKVARPNFGCLYDEFHSNIEERDPVGSLTATFDAIKHIHITENHRGAPGTGHIDHAATIRAARDAGYDGWFTVEAFGQALPDLAAATKIWRPLFETEDQVVKAGVRVIREGWAS